MSERINCEACEGSGRIFDRMAHDYGCNALGGHRCNCNPTPQFSRCEECEGTGWVYENEEEPAHGNA